MRYAINSECATKAAVDAAAVREVIDQGGDPGVVLVTNDEGAPPVGRVRQAPDHRVSSEALASAASTPPVLTSDPARQYCMVWLNVLARHLQPQTIQARKRAQIRAIKGRVGHVGYRTFRVAGVSPRCCGRGWCGGVR